MLSHITLPSLFPEYFVVPVPRPAANVVVRVATLPVDVPEESTWRADSVCRVVSVIAGAVAPEPIAIALNGKVELAITAAAIKFLPVVTTRLSFYMRRFSWRLNVELRR